MMRPGVLVMSPRAVSQEQLIHCVRLRNQVRRLTTEIEVCAGCIFSAIDCGAAVQLGVHVAEIQEKSRGGRCCRVLLVDGKSLDEL